MSKKQLPDPNPIGIQKINFNRNLDQPVNTTLFVSEDVKETIVLFSQGILRVLRFFYTVPKLLLI